MRPLRVELEGFSAYRDRTVVSFEDADLFAFVGPTGSGKSSIIDAITFALYGSVARYQNTGAVAPVINAQSAEAKVRLDFELDGVELHRGAGRAAHEDGRHHQGSAAPARRRGARRRRPRVGRSGRRSCSA